MLVWSTFLRKFVVLFFVLGLSLGLTACSWTSERQAVYEKKAEHDTYLEAPPDLTIPAGNNALDIPSIGSSAATYSRFTGSQQQTSDKVLASVSGDARIVRDGGMQWLEIKASADALWPQLIAFVRNEGFEIKNSDTRLGLIETDWQENRVNIPSNWFSKLISKIYESGLRDKYRIRVEKAEKSVTRIFIAHQGLQEKSTPVDNISHVDTWWELRESDPELEAEMMQRFLVYRGVGESTAKAMVKAPDYQERAILREEADSAYLQINENFPRSWRRTGLALDRIGVLVEDRNRSAGMYYIKLTEEYWKTHEGEDKGWLGSLFSSSERNKEGAYILKLVDEGETTRVLMLNRDNTNATDKTSRQLLVQLQSHLR